MRPLGAVGPDLAAAVCPGFARRRVERALPDAWDRIDPSTALQVRRRAAAAALAEVVPEIDSVATKVVPLLSSVARSAPGAGRPLFAANVGLDAPEDPVEALWQLTTTLREHRGDGHVASLVAHDVDPLEAHMVATTDRAALEGLRESRGFGDDEWGAGRDRLVERGIIAGSSLTPSGAALHRAVSMSTDVAAWHPWDAGLTAEGVDLVLRILRPVADAIWRSRILPLPNPIGVTPP